MVKCKTKNSNDHMRRKNRRKKRKKERGEKNRTQMEKALVSFECKSVRFFCLILFDASKQMDRIKSVCGVCCVFVLMFDKSMHVIVPKQYFIFKWHNLYLKQTQPPFVVCHRKRSIFYLLRLIVLPTMDTKIPGKIIIFQMKNKVIIIISKEKY